MNKLKTNIARLSVVLFITLGISFGPALATSSVFQTSDATMQSCTCAEEVKNGLCNGPTTRVCTGGSGCEDVCGDDDDDEDEISFKISG